MKKQYFYVVLIILTVTSCSSAPKNTGYTYEMRIYAEADLETGNKEAAKGNFNISINMLKESKRKGILTDDSSLIIRSGLSLGNVLFSVGQEEEAFSEWEAALVEAQKLDNSELLSVSKIFIARGRLISGRTGAQPVLDEVTREAVNIKTDKLYIAFSWQVKGLALRELKNYDEAENAVKQSFAIHDKGKNSENASYDWYLIGSIRSLAGNTEGALEALEKAIDYDRRVENSWGLAASWRAIGDVYRKIGRSDESNEAYNRSKNIYAAMKNEDAAAETEKRIKD
jgi:tetratricopeptide (TPR) repeat protein